MHGCEAEQVPTGRGHTTVVYPIAGNAVNLLQSIYDDL